jgi:hypothetical protein
MSDHKRVFTDDDAKAIGDRIGIDWTEITLWEFARGLEVELEHGMELGADTNVTMDDPEMTGRIAHAHLKEFPDYYKRLDEMEEAAEKYWAGRSRKLADQPQS